jgi:hypothetical protein
MNVNQVRSHGSRRALHATPVVMLALGLALQACGGAGPEGDPTAGPSAAEKTGSTQQDLSFLGIQLPEPKVTLGFGDAGLTINPIGSIGELVPPKGITLPDPITPIDELVGDLGKGGSASVTVGNVGLTLTLPGLDLPKLPDPFADGGGIQIFGR